VVSNVTGGIAKVTVSMDLVDTSLADLELLLIPPAGPAIVLAAGLPGTQLGTNCANGRLTFDDDAAQPIEAGTSPYVGTFRCDVPLLNLDGLTGSQVNGVWLLEVIDFISNTSSGSIVCWSLNITPANCTDGGGPCDICNGPFTGSVTTNDLPIAARVNTTGLPSACGATKLCPVPGNAAHYDLYTFTNGGPDSCVLVTLDSPCTTATNALAGCAAYLNAFNPSDICANYLGDIGSFTNSPSTFSVTVPAGAVFVIVVCGARDECPDYSLTVNGFDCAARLGIGHASTGVRVNWPTFATDYKLESTTNLASPNWRIVTNTQTANNGDFVITNNPSTPQIFYRLHKP
jgi:subtilisin-like proprotein convertase family protein